MFSNHVSGNDSRFFIGIIMKRLTEADFAPLRQFKSWVNKELSDSKFSYVYASSGEKVTFRLAEIRKYGFYNTICVVADTDGKWMDAFDFAHNGFHCRYPSICKQNSYNDIENNSDYVIF